MSGRELTVSLSDQHVKRLSLCAPIEAICELVWNALDAGSTKVWISIYKNKMGGIDRIEIADNGSGISAADIDNAFGSLGESPKSSQNINSRGKQVHGKLGEGRFRAYSLGHKVEWITKGKNGKITKISSSADKPRSFFIDETKETIQFSTGTRFVAHNGYGDELKVPDEQILAHRLLGNFAPKLLSEPDLEIVVGDVKLNPLDEIHAQDVQKLSAPFNNTEVKTVVWKRVAVKELVWTDQGYNSRATDPLKVGITGSYSVFIASPLVEKAVKENTLSLREGTDLATLKEKAIGIAEKLISKVAKEKIADTIEELKEKRIYPFEGIPKSDLEKLERKVFDVCATHVIESIPSIASGNQDQQKLTFQLLKTAIESSPNAVQQVFENVLKLPKEEIRELSNLLNRVTLTGLIKLGKTVSNRLDFLSAFHHLVIAPDWNKHVLERKQLHKMLEQETWIFGEEFALGTSDETLNGVLDYHKKLLGHGEDSVPVGDEGAMEKIPDLVFGRQFKAGAGDIYEHLVVELKRPTVNIGPIEKSQIEQYASTIWNGKGFDKNKTTWTFIVISTEIKDEVTALINKEDGSITTADPNRLRIYVRTWDSIIQAAKGRMEYLRDKLELQSSRQDGFKYMTDKFPQIISDITKTKESHEKKRAAKKATKATTKKSKK